LRRSALALPLLIAGIAGCGSGGSGDDAKRFDLTTPRGTPIGGAGEPVTAREKAVIRGWTSSLRHGRVRRAARYFGLPAFVANGTPVVKLTTRAQVEQFNRVLSCGAKVVSFQRSEHHFVITKFELTERPGGHCGTGVGQPAWTAILVEKGHITQWLRVADPSGGASMNG
jgi:hypothetical protein